MAGITASQVKALRDKTGAGMMDCKKALAESDGDVETAYDWLRKKGLATAAKRAGRSASQGLVSVAVDGTVGAVVEVNSETDFVARNEFFQGYVQAVTGVALATEGDHEAVTAVTYPGSAHSCTEELSDLIGKIGENMSFRRSNRLSVTKGAVVSYVHAALTPGMGKIGVLVALESEGDAAKLEVLGKQLAMHVAAANPVAVSRDDVDASLLEREKDILSEQARASGKPENIIEKMVEGRLRKFYEEVCLLEQIYVVDGESKIQDVLDAAAKDVGAAVSVTAFVRMGLGEGVEAAAEEE